MEALPHLYLYLYVVLASSRGLFPTVIGSKAGASWRRQRFWYAVPQHHLLEQCRFNAKTWMASLKFSSSKASLAYLHDHKVAHLEPVHRQFESHILAT